MKNKNLFLFLAILLCVFVCITSIYMSIRALHNISQQKDMYANQNYDFILQRDTQDAHALHNNGNAYVWLATQNPWEALNLLENALASYSGSLTQEENEQTRENYQMLQDFLKKIQQRSESDQDQNQESNESNTGGQEDSENTSNSGSTENTSESLSKQDNENKESSENSTLQNERGEGYYMQESDQIWEMTQEEREALEQITESLKQQEIWNQRYFNKSDTNSLDSFESYFDTLFPFDEEIQRGGEKDW